MSEPLVVSSIQAPGFMGANTQDSSVSLESGFATTALNCVIDKFGRIGARKGWTPTHSSAITSLANADVESIGELIGTDGTSYVIFAGNNKLYRIAAGVVTQLTYGGGGTAPSITASNWQMAPLSNCLYLYQLGHDPLVYDPTVSTTTYRRISEKSGYLGVVENNNCVISAYGRTWSASSVGNKSKVQFSDLLSGHILNTGTAGYLDISAIWPNGADEITALAAHNHTLIVFGRRQILVYQGAEDPSTMKLQDTISGVGCCARDSVVVTGTDVFFLSDAGVRSLARTIQEKSAPIRDISSNVRDDLVRDTIQESDLSKIKGVYSDVNAFYLLTFPSSVTTYCFDMRKPLQDGSARVTTWSLVPTALFSTRDKTLLMGFEATLGKYSGLTDNEVGYRFVYLSSFFDLGQPSNIKVLKKIGFTIIGGSEALLSLKYGYDYSPSLRAQSFSLAKAGISEYGVAEYGIAEYSSGIVFDNQKLNTGGNGNVLQVGIESEIKGFELSIQKLDVFCKLGRTR